MRVNGVTKHALGKRRISIVRVVLRGWYGSASDLKNERARALVQGSRGRMEKLKRYYSRWAGVAKQQRFAHVLTGGKLRRGILTVDKVFGWWIRESRRCASMRRKVSTRCIGGVRATLAESLCAWFRGLEKAKGMRVAWSRAEKRFAEGLLELVWANWATVYRMSLREALKMMAHAVDSKQGRESEMRRGELIATTFFVLTCFFLCGVFGECILNEPAKTLDALRLG